MTALEMVREIGGQVDTGMEIMQQSIEMSEGQRFFGSFVQVVEPTRSFIRRGKVFCQMIELYEIYKRRDDQ